MSRQLYVDNFNKSLNSFAELKFLVFHLISLPLIPSHVGRPLYLYVMHSLSSVSLLLFIRA